jgi:hypothetical protein
MYIYVYICPKYLSVYTHTHTHTHTYIGSRGRGALGDSECDGRHAAKGSDGAREVSREALRRGGGGERAAVSEKRFCAAGGVFLMCS